MNFTMEVVDKSDYSNYTVNQLQFDPSLGFVENFFIRTVPNEDYVIFTTDANLSITQNNTFAKSVEKPLENSIKDSIKDYHLKVNADVEKSPASDAGKKCNKIVGPFKCPACEKVFAILSQFRIHMRKHQGKKQFQCSKCDEGFNQEVNFKIHLALHEQGNPVCPLCSRRYQRMASLKAHLMIHRMEETFICFYCQDEYDKEEEFNKHLESHEGQQIDKINNELPLKCDHCNYMFGDVNKYKEHLLLHIKARKFVNVKSRLKRDKNSKIYKHKCDYCGKTFSKSCLLIRHKRIHTGEKPFACDICGKRFSQKGTLNIHLNKHTNTRKYACMFCPAKFVQKGNLRAHLVTTHAESKPGEKLYKCTQCPCVFKKISSLNGHVTRVHPLSTKEVQEVSAKEVINHFKTLNQGVIQSGSIENYNRSVDGEKDDEKTKENLFYVKVADGSVGGTVKRYKLKQRVIGEHKWYLCNVCSKEFKKPSDLIRHMRIHTKEKPYKCPECEMCFSQKSTLTSHQATHKKNGFECLVCKRNFSSIRSLNVHLKKHDCGVACKPYNYKCSHCDKSFNSMELATRHLDVHSVPENVELPGNNTLISLPTNDNILQPDEITESSPLNFNITYESSQDAVDRPYKCHFCTLTFKRGSHLKRHMILHSGIKDFRCEVCEKSFSTRDSLNAHMKFHTKTKNYKCPICASEFYTSSSLERHVNSHLGNRNFTCPYCNKSFCSREYWKKHMNRHEHAVNDALSSVEELPLNNTESAVLNQDQCEDVALFNNDLQLQDGSQIYFNLEDLQLQNPVNDLLSPLKQISSEPILTDISEQNLLYPLEQSSQEFNVTSYDAITATLFSNGLSDVSIMPFKPSVEEILPKDGSASEIQIQETAQNKKSPPGINCYSLSFSDCDEVPVSSTELPNIENNNEMIENTENTNIEAKTSSKDESSHYEEIIRKENLSLLDCPACDISCADEDELLKHVSLKHKEMMYKSCQFCGKIFKKKTDLDRHIRTHTGEKPFPCTKCDRSFSLKSTLLSHLRTHDLTLSKDFQCNVCHAFFSSKCSLKTHTLIHSGKKPYSCQSCGESFRTYHHKKAHMLLHKKAEPPVPPKGPPPPINIKVLESILCSDENGQDNLEPVLIHIADQTVDSKILKFQNIAQNLIINLPIRNEGLDEMPVEPLLLQLNSNFKSDENAEITAKQQDEGANSDVAAPSTGHVLKEKKLQCDVCLKFYGSKSALTKHKKTLHGDYKCDKCSKGFESEELLAKHYSSHDGLRTQSCLYCDNMFATRANLKVHMKRMHKSEVLKWH